MSSMKMISIRYVAMFEMMMDHSYVFVKICQTLFIALKKEAS